MRNENNTSVFDVKFELYILWKSKKYRKKSVPVRVYTCHILVQVINLIAFDRIN